MARHRKGPVRQIDAARAWQLRGQGLGITEIARIMGHTRQAIHYRLQMEADERGEPIPNLQVKHRSRTTPEPRRRGRSISEREVLSRLRQMGVER